MIPPHAILVPLAFTPECPLVLEAADALAARSGCDLLLLHVVGSRDPMRQRPPHILPDPLEDCARAITQTPGERVSSLVLEGDPVEEILRTADLYDCSAIVMGCGGTPVCPGHVALAVQIRAERKLHLISRYDVQDRAAV